MPKRISVAKHLSLEELERNYGHAEDRIERNHWKIIWLLAQGYSVLHVASLTDYTTAWVRTLRQRYNEIGPESLAHRRRREMELDMAHSA